MVYFKYPTDNKDLANYFPKEFKSNHIIGYDHSIGIEMCLLAISRGATIIEKHFTLISLIQQLEITQQHLMNFYK